MSDIRLGMIGCGLISHAHGRAARKSTQNIRFVTCASRRKDVATEWAREYGCDSVYTDYKEMLARESLDGVVIATWPMQHREHIVDCLAAGVRNVLCEKALTATVEDAMLIWNEAERTGATVIEGLMYRYHPAMTCLQSILNHEPVGAVDHIHGVFNMRLAEPEDAAAAAQSWRNRLDIGGGVPFDFTCYPVDAIRFFARSLPRAVFANGAINKKYGTMDRLYGQIEFENGVIASVDSSNQASFSQGLVITCEHASLSLPVAWSIPRDCEIALSYSDSFLNLETRKYPVPLEESHDGRLVDFPVYKSQLEHFTELIRGTGKSRVPLCGSIINAFIIEALIDSSRTGKAISIDLPEAIQSAYKEYIDQGVS